MDEGIENIIRIASEEFDKFMSQGHATGVEVEEIEKSSSGNFFVTFGYWAKDSKPISSPSTHRGAVIDMDPAMTRIKAAKEVEKSELQRFLNPWRRKYKRVEVDPEAGKAIAIKMYEPTLGVS